MSRKRALQSPTSPSEQPRGRLHRAYSIAQVCEVLALAPSTFYELRRAGKLPFLEELRPRLGKRVRFRAAPVEAYLSGQWGRS